jgi:hypothetical protein
VCVFGLSVRIAQPLPTFTFVYANLLCRMPHCQDCRGTGMIIEPCTHEVDPTMSILLATGDGSRGTVLGSGSSGGPPPDANSRGQEKAAPGAKGDRPNPVSG